MKEHQFGMLKGLNTDANQGLKTLLSVLDALPELAFLLSSDGEYLEIFGDHKSLLMKEPEELLGKTVYDVMPKEKADFIVGTIRQALSEKRNIVVEYELEVAKGVCLFEAGITPMEYPESDIQAVIWFARDITLQRKEEDRLRFLAFNDALTGLPNRRLLEQRLEEETARCQRHNKISAVLFIDLDGFKSINDRYGHQVGDSVLVNTAQRLQKVIRRDDFACRLSGDEFVAILSMIGNDRESAKQNALVSAEHLLTLLRESIPVDIELNEVQRIETNTSASIGVTLLPSQHPKPKVIINEADRAMYSAKLADKDKVLFFEENCC